MSLTLRLPSTLILLQLCAPSLLATQWVETDCETLLSVANTTTQDAFGWRVLDIGDVDRDGVPDFATSAPLSGQGAPAGGMVEVYSGADGSLLWKRTETLTSAILGYDMGVLDWNADGVLDLVASAPFNGSSGGRVWIFSGVDGGTLQQFTSIGGAGEHFGGSIALHGDFDGDGVEDVAVGAPQYDSASVTEAGRVYVLSGAGGALIAIIEAPVLATGDQEFGIGLAFLGDVSVPADGRDDIAVSYRDSTFWSGGVVAYEFDGTTALPIWSITGVGQDYNLFGNRLDGGLDVNEDGYGDLLKSATGVNQARVFSGLDGSSIHTLDGKGEGGDFGAGHMIPDADGDGCADLLLGARNHDGGATDAGRVLLYSGKSGAIVHSMTYTVSSHRIGMDARQVGDLDGDGHRDFALSGTGGGTSGPPPGRLLVVHALPPFEVRCDANPNSTGLPARIDAFGSARASVGDLILAAHDVPDQPGLFLHGANPNQIPFGNSFLCALGGLQRGRIVHGEGHEVRYPYDGSDARHDLTNWIGSTRHFQLWIRDPAAGGAGFTTSDAMVITILP